MRTNKAFTIVELLIVIVVIAILAAITVVAYNGIQTRAKGTQLSSALNQAAKKLELYKVDNSVYPLTGNLAAAGVSNSSSLFYQYTSNGTTYNLTASSGGVSYSSTNSSSPTSGAYSGHVSGGVITNIVTNPGMTSGTTKYYCWPGGNGVVSGSRVTAAWTTRGYAYRSTYTTGNSTTYQGTNGWNIPNTSSSPEALQPNTQYTAAWKVNMSTSQRIRPIVGNVKNEGGANGSATVTSNADSGEIIIQPNTPTVQWITFTTDANAIAAYIATSVRSGTGAVYSNAGDYMEVGDFMLVKGAIVPNYADGSSTNWSWSGSPDASTSTGPAT